MNNNRFEFIIEALSPLHIGCGEEYDPLSYVIDEQASQMCQFDLFVMLNSLDVNKRKKVESLSEQGSSASLFDLIKLFNDNNKIDFKKRILLPHGFIEQYKRVLEQRKGFDQFAIERTAYCVVDDRPYIPGSSVKGALRTAYLNMLNESLKKKHGHAKNKDHQKILKKGAQVIERDLLKGSFSSDPFSLVQVSDFLAIGDIKSEIVYARYLKKSGYINGNPITQEVRNKGNTALEIIPAGSQFRGTIRVIGQGLDRCIRKIDIKVILDALGFYSQELQKESKELHSLGVRSFQAESSSLLRVGRHSGAESITIKGCRSIFIKGSKNNNKPDSYKDHATAIWFASSRNNSSRADLVSFSWASLEEIKVGKKESLDKIERDYQKTRLERELATVEQNRLALEEEKKRLAEEQRLLEEKEARKREEQNREQERIAWLASLSPEQKEIEDLATYQGRDKGNKIDRLYDRLNQLSANIRVRAAEIIMSYWQENNLWGTGLPKRQRNRIARIEKILQGSANLSSS